MSKVYAFLGFALTLTVGLVAVAFVVRNFAPVGLRGLFDFQGS